MTKLSANDVHKLARLCQLKLSDEEVKYYQRDLSAILEYVEILQKVDTGDLEPTSQVTGLVNIMRPDELIDYGTSPDSLLQNAPAIEHHQLKVKRIIT